MRRMAEPVIDAAEALDAEPEMIKACPVCGQEVRGSCYHDGEDFSSQEMPIGKAEELRDDYDDPEQDARLDEREDRRADLARIQERLTGLFYLLMRDVMPVGTVKALADQLMQYEQFDFSSSELEALARRHAEMLMGSTVAVMPKLLREWVETFPPRIRDSEYFEDVLREVDSERGLEPDHKTLMMVQEEVVRRERARRRELRTQR
jgi:hypothetical protein